MFESIEHHDIRVVGIDPGTDTYGVAKVRITEDKMIHIDDAFTVSAIRDLTQTRWMRNLVNDHGSRLVRINHLADLTAQLIHDYEPDRLYYESPFFRRKTVGSFEALTQCMTAVQCILYRTSPYLPVNKISPQEGKAVVSVVGKGSQKELMSDRLKLLDGIVWHIELSSLDEHSVDAIVIAIAGIKRLDLW